MIAPLQLEFVLKYYLSSFCSEVVLCVRVEMWRREREPKDIQR